MLKFLQLKYERGVFMKLYAMFMALLLSGLAQASIEPGSYTGRDQDGITFELHLQELPERQGSFLAIVNDSNWKRARVFLVDEFNTNKYGMLPLVVTKNYNLGVESSTPVLALTESHEALIITSNKGSSGLRYDTSITFKTKTIKPLALNPLNPGSYDSRNVLVSELNLNKEATLNSKSKKYSGDFIVREVRPNVYIVLQTSLTQTGIKLDKNTRDIAIFMKTNGLFGSEKLFIIDEDGEVLTIFKK
jgi:hypothetical protein